MSIPSWLNGMFRAIDAFDADRFAGYLAEDVKFQLGNAPVVEGREATRKTVAELFAAIQGIRHEDLEAWTPEPATTICRGKVTYLRHDGSSLTVPFAMIFELAEDQRIREYLIYVDISRLFAV